MVHVSPEELSALLDGELSAQGELRARLHLAECAACSAEYAVDVRLDQELRQPPVLSCASVLDLLSASFDGEADPAEQAVGRRHLAGCESCRKTVLAMPTAAVALRALPPEMPSQRVDAAIRGLVERRRARQPARVSGIAARALIAVTAVIAIVVAGLGTGVQAPTIATPSDRVLVASAQQIVFNARNNTLYVLDAKSAAVDAREPSTNYIKARIIVGGEPTALALNESANTILVLDASQKRVTEIDAASNTVIGATTVAVSGTPTSISVDPAIGKIIVTTVSGARSSASPAGAVAVIDSDTKQVESVRQIDVAPRLVVPDPQRSRTAFVAADATTIVDGSYNVIATLPGGVSAAFSRRGDNIAVLSAVGSGSGLSFTGPNAPLPLKLAGAPRSMIALPDGGYLVLSDVGGRGQVTRISSDGGVIGAVEVALATGDLVYDGATNSFTIASAGGVLSAEMPAQVATVRTTAPPQTATASASPSASPTVLPSASPSAAASPAVAVAAPTFSPSVADQAKLISTGLYTIPLPNEVRPQLVATRGSRLWILDQANGVEVFDMNTGEFFTIGMIRADARVSYWVAGPTYVFGVDASTGNIHVIDADREQLVDTYATNVLSAVSVVAAGLDNRLWIGLRNAPYLLAFDPVTKRMDSFNLGIARVSALTVDPRGRILYSDDQRGAVGTFDPKTSRLNEVSFARRGTTTALMVDTTSTLWLGTSTGEVYAVRGGAAKLTVSLQRPVSAFAADQSGHAWYLAPLPNGLNGYAYAPADGSRAPTSVPGPAVSLTFNPLGRAFLGDPRGAFFMSIEGGR